MGETQRKYVLTLRIAVFAFLLMVCPSAFALNPALDISQYSHATWRTRDGFVSGEINSIAQTPDGYLWLGTGSGLFRFDGMKPVLWQPPADQHLPSTTIMKLLVARDGRLWIGTDKGLVSLKDGKLTQYPELADNFIFSICEDHDDIVWIGTTSIPNGKLFSIGSDRVQSFGGDGSFGRGVFSLYEDRKGSLWVGVAAGLWRWKPGPPKFFPLSSQEGARTLGEDDDGALLVTIGGRMQRFVDGKVEPYRLPDKLQQALSRNVLRDRDGGLWIGLYRNGLAHVHQGKTDLYSSGDGLSSNNVQSLFEDREGDIWVVTPNGIDRFRDFAVPTISITQGLSEVSVWSALAAKEGGILVATNRDLCLLNNGELTAYRTRAAQGEPGTNAVTSLFQDTLGRIWVVSNNEFGYLENDTFIPLRSVPGGVVRSMAEDDKGNLWVANQNLGLFCIRGGEVIQRVTWTSLGRKDFAASLAVDSQRGGLWIGFFQGGIAYFSDGKVQSWYGVNDGLGAGRTNKLQIDPDGTLWIATENGLSRLKNGHFSTLTIRNGLPCGTIHWFLEDDDRALWIYTTCGLVRVVRSELDSWAAAVDESPDATPKIQTTFFGISDGVVPTSYPLGFTPAVTKTADGRLWFPSPEGISIIDPRHLTFNRIPPPVQIEQFIVDHRPYAANAQTQLPPLIRNLQIDYTALSLAAPEKILFRYKLEPWDSDWQDVGNRRQAFYNNLPPGNYRFRVIACNNSGVWNEEGDFLDFSIAPAYYQTTLFRLSCAAAFLLLLVVIYQLRVRHVARQFNIRFEERVNERTRIARDLHDTLLQSFQGLLLKFQAVTYFYPERAAEARTKLEGVIEQAEQAIIEGRDAVQGLRSSTAIGTNLAEAISALGDELTTDPSNQRPHDFAIREEGATRELAPLLHDEVYRIAGEALRNSFRHAHAKRIEVEIHYDWQKFRLRIRDNGRGIDPKIVDQGGLDRHYGLAGMRERAELVGGKLEIWSEINSGTEVEFTVPASIAYAKSPASRWPLAFWKKS
jgi:ligand-binding sensor domain-containing protein